MRTDWERPTCFITIEIQHRYQLDHLKYGEHGCIYIRREKCRCKGIKNLVLGRSKYDHATPMLRELHWLPIKARIEYKLALTCFKSKSGNYPSYISDLLVPYTPTRSLRSSSSNNFSIPRIHLKGFGERAFTFSGPSVWNALPQELKSCSTLGHFKKQMKTHLFRKYLNWLALPF